jgi:hypothetical protein
MSRRKSKGPEIYPCGTPCFVTPQSENISWMKIVNSYHHSLIHIPEVWFDPFINFASYSTEI